jgi:cell division protein FtsI (penicillin-binding protein 3)
MTAESIGQVRLTGVGAGRPFGQGIFVTPLQLTAALSAIANGGILMQPYLVQEVKMGEARLAYDPRLVRQVISPLAARAVREMMLATVDGAEATAQKAAVPQYRVAGVASVPGSVAPSADSASFVGFVPADSPRFAILVKIDRPQTSALGAEVAAPAFRAVAEHLLAYYRVSPPLTTAGLHR